MCRNPRASTPPHPLPIVTTASVFHNDGVHETGTPLVLADVTVVTAGVYGNGLSKIYRQHAPLPGNEEPGAVSLDVGLRSTHFADDVAIRELLVIRDAGGDRGSIAVQMYDVVAGIAP